jgi:hypothetical protein
MDEDIELWGQEQAAVDRQPVFRNGAGVNGAKCQTSQNAKRRVMPNIA